MPGTSRKPEERKTETQKVFTIMFDDEEMSILEDLTKTYAGNQHDAIRAALRNAAGISIGLPSDVIPNIRRCDQSISSIETELDKTLSEYADRIDTAKNAIRVATELFDDLKSQLAEASKTLTWASKATTGYDIRTRIRAAENGLMNVEASILSSETVMSPQGPADHPPRDDKEEHGKQQ